MRVYGDTYTNDTYGNTPATIQPHRQTWARHVRLETCALTIMALPYAKASARVSHPWRNGERDCGLLAIDPVGAAARLEFPAGPQRRTSGRGRSLERGSWRCAPGRARPRRAPASPVRRARGLTASTTSPFLARRQAAWRAAPAARPRSGRGGGFQACCHSRRLASRPRGATAGSGRHRQATAGVSCPLRVEQAPIDQRRLQRPGDRIFVDAQAANGEERRVERDDAHAAAVVARVQPVIDAPERVVGAGRDIAAGVDV